MELQTKSKNRLLKANFGGISLFNFYRQFYNNNCERIPNWLYDVEYILFQKHSFKRNRGLVLNQFWHLWLWFNSNELFYDTKNEAGHFLFKNEWLYKEK